ncbi:hypothetical protein [Brevundimonas diminuta]|uniref:hypothetical protein n=1 Tax=Brevundimonas diminuta TaxID=293 RepID=UPI003209B5A7
MSESPKIGLQFRTADGKDTQTFGGFALAQRPDLAAKIAVIGASWAFLEAHAGYLLGILMKADPTTSVALLGRFTTPTAKTQTIIAVAKETLDENQFIELKVLLRRFSKIGQLRNEIAHGLWGIDSRQAEELAWLPATVMPAFAITLPDLMAKGIEIGAIVDDYTREIKYYSGAALDKIAKETDSLTNDLMHFTSELATAAIITRYGGPVGSAPA